MWHVTSPIDSPPRWRRRRTCHLMWLRRWRGSCAR